MAQLVKTFAPKADGHDFDHQNPYGGGRKELILHTHHSVLTFAHIFIHTNIFLMWKYQQPASN